ncbi:hypothetical protein GCM10011332_29440 [Terasakiella brassicae]|uniref:Uncharacterized protein n=1 Tax=Terasakiella brassicae TaxID=1634917 RepID=A0A917C8C9_9PROT|nr:hypothetical protein [Terasakiella brassicae]GGF73481.1 hypothetical protein GCM10011332_29440 [Terasakiella brassicae]
MDTRKLYANLKSLGTVETADEYSNMFGYGGSTIRSQWAKDTSPDLSAWVRLWFSLNSIADDTEGVIKTTHNSERDAYLQGLEELHVIQSKIWKHIAALAT